MPTHVVRLAVAALAVAAAGVVVGPPGAQAATCSGSSGVSVVVDFHQLRSGGAQTACDSGGAGEYAAKQFTDVGHTLTYVQDEAFVCQVDGLGSPQCAHTPPADAYWSLWWSDGKSGKWTYSALGVGSLKVPAGGYVALSWQKGTGQAPPRVTPTAHAPSSPTASPTAHPTRHPSPTPQSASASPTTAAPTTTAPPTPTASSSPRRHPRHPKASPGSRRHPHHTLSPQAGGAVSGVAAGAATSGGSGGLPGWVAPAAVVLLFAVGGTVALVRRRRSGGA